MEIAGEIGIFENQKACGPLRKHLFGAKRFAQWWFVAAMLAGDILVSTLIEKVALGYGWLGVMLFTIAALFFWLRYARRLGPKAWMARGVPAVSPITYRIEDAGLVLDSQTSMTRVAWSGMSQIAPGNASWPGLVPADPVLRRSPAGARLPDGLLRQADAGSQGAKQRGRGLGRRGSGPVGRRAHLTRGLEIARFRA
jgi:hypothetical protein